MSSRVSLLFFRRSGGSVSAALRGTRNHRRAGALRSTGPGLRTWPRQRPQRHRAYDGVAAVSCGPRAAHRRSWPANCASFHCGDRAVRSSQRARTSAGPSRRRSRAFHNQAAAPEPHGRRRRGGRHPARRGGSRPAGGATAPRGRARAGGRREPDACSRRCSVPGPPAHWSLPVDVSELPPAD